MSWYLYEGIRDYVKATDNNLFFYDSSWMTQVRLYLEEKEGMGLIREIGIWRGERTVRTSPCKFRIMTTSTYWEKVFLPHINTITPVIKHDVSKQTMWSPWRYVEFAVHHRRWGRY